MARNLTSAMLSAITAGTVRPVLIAKIGTSGADVLVWNGVGSLLFDGDTYLGVGKFGGVSSVEENSSLQASGLTFTLSGIPSAYISMALQSMRYGRRAILWFGLLDTSTGALIDTPEIVFSGLTDVPAIDEGPDRSSIALTAENRLIDLDRPRVRRYTQEDQKIDYPDDLGFEYVQSLQDAKLFWGSIEIRLPQNRAS